MGRGRARLSLLLGSVVVFAELITFPQNASAISCGDVPFEGMCNGAVLNYCFNEELVTVNCALLNASCDFISAQWGYDCTVSLNSECVSYEEGWAVFCRGDNNGCVFGLATNACTANIAPCDEVLDVSTCRGDQALVACKGQEALLLDCPSYGGATCANGICVDAPEGSPCDPEIQCASTLTCSTEGFCAHSVSPPDAGRVAADAAPARDVGPRPEAQDGGVTTTERIVGDGGGSSSRESIFADYDDNDLRRQRPRQDPNAGCSAMESSDPMLIGFLAILMAFMITRRRWR